MHQYGVFRRLLGCGAGEDGKMTRWGEIKCPRCDDTFQMYVDANEARIDAEAKLAGAVAECERIGRLWHDAEAKLAKAVRFLNGLDKHGVYTTDELEDLLAELKGDTP